jgi:hypothetical protein
MLIAMTVAGIRHRSAKFSRGDFQRIFSDTPYQNVAL